MSAGVTHECADAREVAELFRSTKEVGGTETIAVRVPPEVTIDAIKAAIQRVRKCGQLWVASQSSGDLDGRLGYVVTCSLAPA